MGRPAKQTLAWMRISGNLELAPHGVYPARGTDRWGAIACQSDTAWRPLGQTMGLDRLAADPARRSSATTRTVAPT